MEQHITTEAVIGFFTLLSVIIGGYVKLQTKIKELEIRLLHVEKQDDKIIDKLDMIADNINDLKLELQTKQDKN